MWFGARWILLWPQIGDALRTHAIIFAAGAAAMAAVGAFLFALRPSPALRWGGASASALCGLNLMTGIATGDIPCGGGT